MRLTIRYVLLTTLLLGVLAACTAQEDTAVIEPAPVVQVAAVAEQEVVEEAPAVAEEAVVEETAVAEVAEEAPTQNEEPEAAAVDAAAVANHNSYQPDVTLLAATGRPQFVSAYADW